MEDSDHQPGTLKAATAMDHQSTQSVAVISSNEDLLTEILIRLPVTSILRFKSVSKHWRLFLTHKHFTNRYENNNLYKSPLGYFASTKILLSTYKTRFAGHIYVPFDVKYKSTPPFLSLDFYFKRSGVGIVHSSNGLLICRAIHKADIEYYAFNPTTKQLACIPSVPKTAHIMALAFHPTHCVHYKVVCICALKPRRKNMFQIQVYTSETRKWKICIESFSAHISEIDYPVYYNGVVYWAPDFRRVSKFVCFKLDAEQLQMLPLPVEKMSYERVITCFGESRGHLHLIFYATGEEYLLRVNVYEMLTDHSGWFVKYRVQLDGLILRDFPCLVSQYEILDDFGEIEHRYQSNFKIVDVVRGKEEEDTFLVLSSNGKMIRYNVHKKSFKELYRCNNYNLHLSSFHRYIENLSSL